MEDHITVSALEGTNAKLFRIPNNTDDYIEITNWGCRMKSIYIHNRLGSLQNVLCTSGMETVASWAPVVGAASCPRLEDFLTRQLWEVGEVGTNHVFFSCTASAKETGLPYEVKVGAKITWVNLNRLIVDLYLTPQQEQTLNLTTGLPFRLSDDRETYIARTFCSMVETNGEFIPVDKTHYREISFNPVQAGEQRFQSLQEDIKPMMELASTTAGLAISAYGTPSIISCRTLKTSGGVSLQFVGRPELLQAGETLTERVIYGFDPLFDEVEFGRT